MKRLIFLGVFLMTGSWAHAATPGMPRPLGLELGSQLAKTKRTLATLKATVTVHETTQPGIDGGPYTYTRLEASFARGPIERVKLYFYAKKLARMKLLSRDTESPIHVSILGSPSLQSPTGRTFWWNHRHISGVSCQGRSKATRSSSTPRKVTKGECELFDMRVLVDVLGNRQHIEVQYQMLIQSAIEKVEKLKQGRP